MIANLPELTIARYSAYPIHGYETDWRVVSLPHVLKAAKTPSPLDQALKRAHNSQDIERCCAMLGLPFTEPEVRPLDAKLARLTFYRLKRDDPQLAKRFARAAMSRYFGAGKETRTTEQMSVAVRALGISTDTLQAALEDGEAKAALIAMLQVAVDDGMFGAPYAVVHGQRFWGHDRVTTHLDWWLGRNSV